MFERRDLVTRFRAFQHRGTECYASIVRDRRNVKPADRRLSRNLHVHFAIQRYAAGEADIRTARGRNCRSRYVRSDDLKLLLAAGRDVGEPLVQRLSTNTARSQKVFEFFGKDPLLPRSKVRWRRIGPGSADF